VSEYFLDGDLFYLGRDDQPGVFNFLVLETDTLKTDTKVCLVFTSQAIAEKVFPNHTVLTLNKSDPRAKEEFFRAALSVGASEVWVDSLEPMQRIPTLQALYYILSLKNQTACF
jgi:hypothetical protein